MKLLLLFRNVLELPSWRSLSLLDLHALLSSAVLILWSLSLFLFSSIVDPFVDFCITDAEPRGNVWNAARAPAIVHLKLVLQASRLLWVEALALDPPEKGLILLVFLDVTLVVKLGLVIGQHRLFTHALLLRLFIKLFWLRRWLVKTLNRLNVRNRRYRCETSLGQGRFLPVIVLNYRCCVYLLMLLALSQLQLDDMRRRLVLVTAGRSFQNFADTGKPNWDLRRQLLRWLDSMTNIHLACEQCWRKALLGRASIFDRWLLHRTHHVLFKL